VALADADDQHHARAAAFLPTALAEYQRLVTTDLVVGESGIILTLALGHACAINRV
jgi:predicted nucleic acid-binding protein